MCSCSQGQTFSTDIDVIFNLILLVSKKRLVEKYTSCTVMGYIGARVGSYVVIDTHRRCNILVNRTVT